MLNGSGRISISQQNVLSIALFIAICIGFLVAHGYGIFAIMVGLTIIILVFLNDAETDRLIALCILLVALPFNLAIMGRNFGTILTWLLFLSFTLVYTKSIYNKKSMFQNVLAKKYFLLALLSAIPFIIPLFFMDPIIFESSVGLLMVYMASLTFFSIVISLTPDEKIFIKLINYLIIVFLLFALTIMLQYFYPQTATALYDDLFGSEAVSYSFIQHIIWEGTISRASGIIGNYEFAATIMAFGLILSFSLLFSHHWLKYVSFFLISIFMVALVMTGTRGAIFSLIIGFLYMIFCINRLKLASISSLFVMLIAVSILTGFLLYGPFEMFYYRLIGTSFEGLIPDTRVFIWTRYWEQITDHSIWIGHGLHRHGLWIGGYQFIRSDVHSLYLHLLYSGGIFALLLFLLLMLQILYNANIIKMKDHQKEFSKQLMLYGIAINTCVIVLLVDQIKVSYLRETNSQHLVWLLLGILAYLSIIINEKLRTQ